MREPSSLKDVKTSQALWAIIEKLFGKSYSDRLYSLLNKSIQFEWRKECKSAVTDLKKKLLEALVLG